MNSWHLAPGMGAAVAAAVSVALGAGCSAAPSDSLAGGGSRVGSGAQQGASPSGSSGGINSGVNNNGGTSGTGGTGGTGGMPSNVSSAEAYFIQTVFPALSTSPDGGKTASCTSCHATGAISAPTFLAGADAAGAYTTLTTSFLSLVTVPANSMIILHGTHTGPALTSAQVAIVTDWLNQEVTARHINPAPLVTVQGELEKFGKCMSLTDFTATVTVNGATRAAADIWNSTANVQGNNYDCQNCHNVGDGGFYAYQDATTMLTQTQSDITFIKKYVTGTVDQNGNFAGLQASNAIRQKAALTQTCTVQGGCHPKINLNPAPGQSPTLAAVDQFVQATLTRYNNNQCP